MGHRGQCKIGNWCVCQWAFSRYLAKAGGCDAIIDLVCDATNMATFTAYSRSKNPDHIAALECIKKKCGTAIGKEAASKEVDALPSGDALILKIQDKEALCGEFGAANDSGTCKSK
jgi:hypothetical protein